MLAMSALSLAVVEAEATSPLRLVTHRRGKPGA
jgi:hypothetical protein